LKAKRRKSGFTQAKLAEKVGVSTHHIAMIEIARHYPTLELLERIANTLDIEIYELFIVKPTPENAMEKLHDSLVCNIEKVVADAIAKNLPKKQ
jgi:transcriptional regulator with XRE-family HTH domain